MLPAVRVTQLSLSPMLSFGMQEKMVEHDAQHRGQVATYLRVLGVERPAAKDWRGLVYGR